MWKPSDYIIARDFCDRATQEAEVQRLRRRVRAEAVVVFVLRSPWVFQSLTLVAHADAARGRRLEDHLTQVELGQGPVPWPATDAAGQLGELLKGCRGNRLLAALAAHLSPRRTVYLTHFARPTRGSAGAMGVAHASLVILFVWQRGKPRPPRRWPWDDLYAMIVADPAVMAHLWSQLVTTLDRELDRRIDQFVQQFDWNASPRAEPDQVLAPVRLEKVLSSGAPAFLQAAIELTGSRVGQLFLRGSSLGRLQVAAQVGSDLPDEFALPGAVPDAYASVVQYVYARNKHILINNVPNFQASSPRVRYLNPYGAALNAELAVPITVFGAGGKAHSVLGVLNVEKQEGLYTSNDLQTMRHIALRFCLWRAHLLNQLCNRSLAVLTGQAETAIDPVATPEDRPELPPYVMAVQDQVQMVIDNLHLLTQSTIVTVRLLSRDGQQLLWFVSSARHAPPEYLPFVSRCHERIPLGRQKYVRSVNAWVAWYGRECYVPNLKVRKPKAQAKNPHFAAYRHLEGYLETHPDVASEYCLPISLGGRVFGTLDLESVHADAYGEHRPFIQAIAAQIGLAFAQLRRRTEQPIFSLSSKLVLNSHELMQCRDRLLTQAKLCRNGAPAGETAEALESIGTAIEQCLGMRELAALPPRAPAGGGTADLAELCRRVALDVDGKFGQIRLGRGLDGEGEGEEDFAVRADTEEARRVFEQAFRVFEQAFREALNNARKAAVAVPGGHVTVSLGRWVLGGKVYGKVTIRNTFLPPLEGPIVRDLFAALTYTAPDGRPHLGSFIAGSLLRSIGGSVHCDLEANGPTPYFRTILELPLAIWEEQEGTP